MSLEYDKDFDPRQVVGTPETLPEGQGVRLKDAAGRTAVVKNGAVRVEKGQVVLRIVLTPVTDAKVFTLRGRVVDEAGAPLADVRATLLEEDRGRPMPEFTTCADAQGRFALTVRIPPAYVVPTWKLKLLLIKPGFHPTRTAGLDAVQTHQAGRGDFGTVTLPKGHTLRGRVLDESGKPLHGVEVYNRTDAQGLYDHLTCRTDAAGQFTMAGLPWGACQLLVKWGDYHETYIVDFDDQHQEFTLKLHPSIRKAEF